MTSEVSGNTLKTQAKYHWSSYLTVTKPLIYSNLKLGEAVLTLTSLVFPDLEYVITINLVGEMGMKQLVCSFYCSCLVESLL